MDDWNWLGVWIMAIIVIVFLAVSSVHNDNVCKDRGYTFSSRDPHANYTIDTGYMSCVNVIKDCINGQCYTRNEYMVVKK